MKHNNIHIIRLPEGEQREQRVKNLFEEIMTENFPNLVKEKRHSSPGSPGAPNKMNPKRPIPKNIMAKMAKVKNKGRILKTARERQLVNHKEALIRLSAHFSTETVQARRELHNIFKVMKSKDLHTTKTTLCSMAII